MIIFILILILGYLAGYENIGAWDFIYIGACDIIYIISNVNKLEDNGASTDGSVCKEDWCDDNDVLRTATEVDGNNCVPAILGLFLLLLNWCAIWRDVLFGGMWLYQDLGYGNCLCLYY